MSGISCIWKTPIGAAASANNDEVTTLERLNEGAELAQKPRVNIAGHNNRTAERNDGPEHSK